MYVGALGFRPELSPLEAELVAVKADSVIKSHIIMAMTVGLIPSPLLDMFAVTAVEVNMIAELAELYRFPIPGKLLSYKLIISLAGGLGFVYLSAKYDHLIKSLPLVGHALYVGAFSLSGGIAIYAVGKIFQKHFESGGVFLSADNDFLRSYFKQKQIEGRSVVPRMILRPLECSGR